MVSGGTVTGDLSSAKNYLNTFNSEITGLSGAWMGASYNNIVSQVDQVVSEINGVLESEMSAFASACDLYKEYEETKQSLNSAQSSYSSAVSEKDSSKMTSYGNQVASLKSRLNELKGQIEGLLSTAGSTVLEGASSTSSVSIDTSALGAASYGTFTEETFTASNGLEVKYYLYKPSYNGSTDVSGLPVMLYIHGGGSNNSYSNVLARGLSKELNEKTITPSGICIIPYVKNFSDKRTVPALKELTDEVVKTTNADSNRISVSGHSYGGITTYNLINSYPNYFAAAIPISGFTEVTDAFKYTKVWAFNGEYDHGTRTSNSGAKACVDQINAIGGQASFYSYKGYGHSYVQDFTYERTFESPDGIEEEPIEWAFRQKKDTTKTQETAYA